MATARSRVWCQFFNPCSIRPWNSKCRLHFLSKEKVLMVCIQLILLKSFSRSFWAWLFIWKKIKIIKEVFFIVKIEISLYKESCCFNICTFAIRFWDDLYLSGKVALFNIPIPFFNHSFGNITFCPGNPKNCNTSWEQNLTILKQLAHIFVHKTVNFAMQWKK